MQNKPLKTMSLRSAVLRGTPRRIVLDEEMEKLSTLEQNGMYADCPIEGEPCQA